MDSVSYNNKSPIVGLLFNEIQNVDAINLTTMEPRSKLAYIMLKKDSSTVFLEMKFVWNQTF